MNEISVGGTTRMRSRHRGYDRNEEQAPHTHTHTRRFCPVVSTPLRAREAKSLCVLFTLRLSSVLRPSVGWRPEPSSAATAFCPR